MESCLRILELVYLTGVIFYIAYLITSFHLRPTTRLDFLVQISGMFFILLNSIILLFGILHLMDTRILIPFFTTIMVICIILHKYSFKGKCHFIPIQLQKTRKRRSLILFILVFLVTSSILLSFLMYYNTFRYTPFDFDALFCYLPNVVHWLQSGGLGVWNESPELLTRYHPCGYFLLTYWFLFILKSDYFMGFIQPTILILSILNCYAIGKKLKIPSIWLILYCCAIFSLPMLIEFATKENNDLGVLYSFTLACYFLLVFRKNPRIAFLFMAGASTGIVLGIKFTGLYWLISLGLLTFCFLIATTQNAKIIIQRYFIWICGVIILGGYWYIRNFIATGNFLFPQTIRLFGIPLYLPNKIFNYNELGSALKLYHSTMLLKEIHILWDKAIDWYFPQFGFMYFMLPLSVIIILVYIIHCILRQKASFKNVNLVFMLIVLLSLFFFLATPASGRTDANIRYGFPPIVLLWLIPGIFHRHKWLKLSMSIIFIVNIVYSIYHYTRFSLYIFVLSLIITLFIISLLYLPQTEIFINRFLILLECKALKRSYIVIALIISILLPMSAKPLAEANRFNDCGYKLIDPYLNKGWEWMDTHIQDKTIGVVQKDYIYPLFNSHFSNKLVPIRASNPNDFLKEVAHKSIEYICFQSLHSGEIFTYTFPISQKWVEDNKTIFKKVYKNKGFVIYKYIKVI